MGVRDGKKIVKKGTKNMKTIKQLAEEIGISKQALQNRIDKLGLRQLVQIDANRFMIDEKLENLIIQDIEKNGIQKSTTNSTSKNDNRLPGTVIDCRETITRQDKMIELLQKELDTKNKQIEDLTKRIGEANLLLGREQELVIELKTQLLAIEEQKEVLNKKIWHWGINRRKK